MPVNDRREPGVYVTIEDASYVAPALEIGRTVLCVGICDRGPHNRITKVTSQAEFHNKFGKPDYNRTAQSHYVFDKALQYTGNGLFMRVAPLDSTVANVSIKQNTSSIETVGTATEFTFTEGSAIINVEPAVFDNFVEGQWIYANDGADSSLEAKQIISRSTGDGTYTLNEPYTGSTTGWSTKAGTANKYNPFIYDHANLAWDTDHKTSDDVSADTIYEFYTTGVGAHYNKLQLKGSRNTELEKMYTDNDGNILYPYLFMNLGVYEVNEDGTDKLVEGPWLISLGDKAPNGVVIRDLASGSILSLPEVINKNSELIRCISGQASAELTLPDSPTNNIISKNNRLQVQLLMTSGTAIGTNNYAPLGNALPFANGNDGTTDGQPMFTSAGNLYQSDEIWGLCTQAYNGSLTSVDGSIEQLREAIYPWYSPDYIVTGGFPAQVQDAGRFLADYRQDCFHLGDTGFQKRYDQDLDARLNTVDWNNWTSMLYTQYREISDQYTGRKIWINPVYHAIERHLSVDASYFVAEPVAGIEKGAISDPITLAYRANHTERGDLQDSELNSTIVEPQGKYFLTQLTTWKRLSILKRAHAAKFVCYIRKVLPPLLKDILQRKATPYWIGQAQTRTEYLLNKFTNSSVERYQILESFSANVEFDDVASELNIYVQMKPLRVIERINVFIVVQ